MYTYSVEAGHSNVVTSNWQDALSARSNMIMMGEGEVIVNIYLEQVYNKTLWTLDQVKEHSKELKEQDEIKMKNRVEQRIYNEMKENGMLDSETGMEVKGTNRIVEGYGGKQPKRNRIVDAYQETGNFGYAAYLEAEQAELDADNEMHEDLYGKAEYTAKVEKKDYIDTTFDQINQAMSTKKKKKDKCYIDTTIDQINQLMAQKYEKQERHADYMARMTKEAAVDISAMSGREALAEDVRGQLSSVAKQMSAESQMDVISKDLDFHGKFEEMDSWTQEQIINPKHYKMIPKEAYARHPEGLEYMDLMEYILEHHDGVESHLLGQIFKYACRLGKKDSKLQDAKKIAWYANRLVTVIEGGQ